MYRLLISDLAVNYLLTNDEKYKNELLKRFSFCGFGKKEVDEFICFEGNIFLVHKKEKNEYEEKTCIDKLFIIGKENCNMIFENKSNYEFNPNNVTSQTLYTSQLLAIIDEANVLSFSSKINNYKSKNEIIKMSKENSENWLYYEFKNRLEYICRCSNKIFSKDKKSIFEKSINKLYDNEMQLCIISRWDSQTVAANAFQPYSSNYGD